MNRGRGETKNSAKTHCKILFSSAGRRVELLRCFRADAASLGISVELLGADVDPARSAACQEADACFQVPRCQEPSYKDKLLEICTQHRIDLLIPLIDPDVEVFSHCSDEFKNAGIDVAVSSRALVKLARDKLRTADFLKAKGISVPRSAPLEAVVVTPDDWRWPLIVKPRSGSSSIGVHVVDSPAALANIGPLDNYVAQEILKGKECTVNLFFDRSGTLRSAVPHLRCEVRAGEVSKALTWRHPQLQAISRAIGAVLPPARGVICFQAMVDGHGDPAVFEINARFGGGYPVTHQAGAHFTRWLLEELIGRPPTWHDEWRDGVMMLRYDAAIFIDHA